MCCDSCLLSPCKTLKTYLTQWIIQSKARMRYRLDHWRASRARRKYLHRQAKVWRDNLDDANLFIHESSLTSTPYNQIDKVNDSHLDIHSQETINDSSLGYHKQGVGVLSPRCLSQRLNENSLAREAVGESDAELAQYLKDERIALFLQNDEFFNELRTNREFINSLQEDYKEGRGEFDDEDYEGECGQEPFTGHLDDATLRERISTMGKASRKKFAQIAKVFSRRKRTSGRSLIPGASGGDLLIQDEEEEKTPPVDEDLDSTTTNKLTNNIR